MRCAKCLVIITALLVPLAADGIVLGPTIPARLGSQDRRVLERMPVSSPSNSRPWTSRVALAALECLERGLRLPQLLELQRDGVPVQVHPALDLDGRRTFTAMIVTPDGGATLRIPAECSAAGEVLEKRDFELTE